jgi:hypothetical protein
MHPGTAGASASACAVVMLAKPLGGSQRGGFSKHLVRQVAGNDATAHAGRTPQPVWPAPVATSSDRQCFCGLGQLDEADRLAPLACTTWKRGIGGGVGPKLLLDRGTLVTDVLLFHPNAAADAAR